MELIYSMRRKPLKCEPPQFERSSDPEVVRPIIAISSCNIIAFTSPTELTDTDGDTWGGHVYVCDLDTPWDCHKVISTIHPVSALDWDIEGRQLVVGTTEGDVSVLGQKDFLLNDWVTLYSANFPGEHIIKAVFFHNGRRFVALDKKHDAPIADKIQALRFTPTLKGFGGVAVPGVCVVSMSGVVGALTAGGGGGGAGALMARASHSLVPHRADRVTIADIAHKNGNLLVAGVCSSRGGGRGGGAGGGPFAVRCALAAVAAPLAVHTQPLPTLLCDMPSAPTALSWCVRAECPSESLAVAGATLALWTLTERAQPVHKMLAKGPVQGSTTPGGGQKPNTDTFNTMVWVETGAWCVEGGRGSAVAVVGAAGAVTGRPHLLLATTAALHLLSTDDPHYICSRVINMPESAAATPPKKTKYGNGSLSRGRGEGASVGAGSAGGAGPAPLCAAAQCAAGGAALVIDARAQLHALRLPQPWTDIPTPLAVQQATSVLEYSLVTGYDCLDILLTLKPNIVEAVYERLTESFQRQPPAFQQFYYHAWLRMRTALCRLVPGGASSVSWLTCLAALSAGWASCAAALRADDRPDDKPLAALLDDHHNDHDKVLVSLEAGATLSLGTEAGALWALRRTLQRAVDIAATALASLHHQPAPHPYELWSDATAVSLLRRLVSLARAAGLGDAALARALARLHAPAPPKPDLIEECGVVAATWGARVWEAPPRAAVSAPHAHYPLHLEYLVEPERLKTQPEPPPALQDSTPPHTMDSIRYMYLGAGGRWRACGRCGARALPHALPCKHPAQRAHDARFLLACRCGGKWTLVSNV